MTNGLNREGVPVATPGQAAYEAWAAIIGTVAPWRQVHEHVHANWETIGQAVIEFYRDHRRDDVTDDLGTFL